MKEGIDPEFVARVALTLLTRAARCYRSDFPALNPIAPAHG